jgi:DnaJ homolog subfamily C member 11
VVLEARYGKLNELIADPDYPPNIDVAIPLQYLVEDSQLILHDGPKTGLLGFYDPRIDEPKELLVKYASTLLLGQNSNLLLGTCLNENCTKL